MEAFRYHVFICQQQKGEGLPCCASRGAAETTQAMRREIAARGLLDEVQITVCGSLGLCERGPTMVVYPGGVWYSGVTAAEVPELVESHFRQGRPLERLICNDAESLRSEVCKNRDRALAAMRAQEAAGVLPEPLMQTVRGYQESRIVLTALELDLFTAAGSGSTAEEIARSARADVRAASLLLNALTAMGLLHKSEGRFSTTPETERFLSARGEKDARAAMLHQSSLWPRWSKLSECVRQGTSVDFDELRERDDNWTRPFIAAMHRNAAERASVVVPAVGASGVRRMLDVGGGSGAYSIAFARANPELLAEILDLDTVLPITRGHIEEAGLADRITTRPADLRTEAFGSGYDLVFVSAICHSLDEGDNQDLVKRCHDALAPGGRLVIQDFILSEDGASPKFAALFSINMLVGTRGGRSYAESEYVTWMRRAGLEDVRRVHLPGPTGLIIGTRPAA